MFLLFIGLASAGLEITGGNAFTVNKTVNVNETIIFTLRNSETFAMQNISFEGNNYIYMPQSTLAPGESKNITAILFSNIPFQGLVAIKGLYQSNLGTSNQSYSLDVDYINGVSNCNIIGIQGDRVRWNNLVSDPIEMRNAENNNLITTIAEASFYETTFETPVNLRYYFLRRGFQFSGVCSFNALSSSGLINNPSYDAQFNLTLNVQYLPTQISTTFLENNYTVNFNGELENVFTIRNNGVNPAKNIKITADKWFTFNPNNFDLESTLTKGVIYKIKPLVLSTNETNKTHSIQIKIEGNFNTITQTFNVFIPYANIAQGNLNGTSLQDLLLQFCAQNPTVCNPAPEIIYRDAGDAEINVSVTQNQLKEVFGLIFDQTDKMELFENFMKEKIDEIAGNNNMTSTEIQGIRAEVSSLKEEQQNSKSFNTLLIFIIVVIIAGGLTVVIWLDHKKKAAMKILRRNGRG